MNYITASLNSEPIEYLIPGSVNVSVGGLSIGDTLTVIQRPLLNIPEIVVPGEEFDIICLAPENITNWNAELLFRA